ncbi:peptidoglycan-binding protein [Marinobacterium sp. YM272]|uniref:peptidoglycan-binding protein n=1 Tax=Marinobacterium sp. YM272 TaxID=3421654 RepID=UPI003D7FAA87
MAMTAIEAVKRLAPHARQEYLEAMQKGDALFQQHGINTPLRMAHFLAQALHETGGFRILRENMSYSAERMVVIFGVGNHSAAVTRAEAESLAHKPEQIAERVYGLGNPRKARELGNDQPGDGFRYRGNGVLQTTGRGGHKRMGDAVGVDFENHPELATDPEHALKPALQEWTEGNLNVQADRNNINAITRRINGGFNGLAHRKQLFNKLLPLLSEEGQAVDPDMVGLEDPEVKQLQQALNDLGADPQLVVDGRMGPKTRMAVRAFQSAAGLGVDGIAGPITEAAIELRLSALRGAPNLEDEDG